MDAGTGVHDEGTAPDLWKGVRGHRCPLHNSIIANFSDAVERWNDEGGISHLPFWKRGNGGGGAFS